MIVEYKIRIEYYRGAEYYPISVYAMHHDIKIAQQHGKNLLGLLNEARSAILTQEEKEGRYVDVESTERQE